MPRNHEIIPLTYNSVNLVNLPETVFQVQHVRRLFNKSHAVTEKLIQFWVNIESHTSLALPESKKGLGKLNEKFMHWNVIQLRIHYLIFKMASNILRCLLYPRLEVTKNWKDNCKISLSFLETNFTALLSWQGLIKITS